MKKYIFLVLMICSTSAFAQRYAIGLKGGINFSNFTGGNFGTVKKNALTGFYGGGFVNFGLGDNVSIQPEVLISTQGASIDSTLGGSNNWKLTYINVPIMVKLKTDRGFYVEAGPQAGFKISSSVPNQTINDFAKGLDLSIGAGLGYDGKSGFGIGVRYMAGLTTVGNFNASQGIDPDFRNSVVQAGLSFKLGGK